MRLKEQKLWDRMREHVGKRVQLQRVENIMVTGMPDVLCLSNSLVTFAELKAVDQYPKRTTTRVLGNEGLSQDQKNWHFDWIKNGGRSIIVVRVAIDLYCLWGNHADAINDYTQAELAQHSFAWGWDGLASALGAK